MDQERLRAAEQALAAEAVRLGRIAECRVHLAREGPAEGGGAVPTTTVRWWDGPTTARMRSIMDDFVPVEPIAQWRPLCYEHHLTAWGRALGVLAWLDEDPRRVALHEAVVTQMAAEQIDRPEHGDPLLQQRASSLLTLNPPGRRFTLSALRLLLQCARADGWDGALRWLDGLDGGARGRLRVVR